jgi:signal transduction histidine kinase/ligand-binding sensor domain-containing protein
MRRSTIVVIGIVLRCLSCAFALNPTLDVSQYAHTAWKVSDGFFKGIVFAIAQTPDGYIWVGADSGLLRFDGVRSTSWQPPAGTALPSSDIRRLIASRDGRLWIGTTRGLASWKDGRLTHHPELDGQSVEALFEDREGTVWVGGVSRSNGRLCTIQAGKTDCYGEDGRFGSGVTALYEDNGGNLWAGAITGLWRWKPGPPKVYPIPDPDNRINALIENDDGGILVAKDSGITKLRNGKAEAFPLPAGLEFQPGNLLRDRHGALWIGAIVDGGVLHIHEGKMDLFTRSGGLSGNTVSALLEDHEGNIWVASVDGLDRFRDFAVPTLSIPQGLSSNSVWSVVAARDGSIWLCTDNGLNRWRNGEITTYRKRSRPGVREGASGGLAVGRAANSPVVREIIDAGLPTDSVDSVFQDSRGHLWVTTHSGVAILKSDRFFPVSSVPHGIVFSIAEDRTGTVWLSHQEGLFRLVQERVVERIPWAKLGRVEPATALLSGDGQDGLWIGFRGGGVASFKEGQLTAAYATGEGLNDLHIDAKGTLWGATEGGLRRIKDAVTLSSQNGLPCNAVHWMMDGDDDSVWLYMACGLVRIAKSELDAWASNPKSTIHVTVFDRSDGVRTQQFHVGYGGIVARSADGKLWFVPFGGVSVIDPRHLPVNKLPPPVHIEQVIADSKTYDATKGLRLPPHVRNLAIDYTALSLVAPEKVRFRYKLDGVDDDWREVVNDRQVQYSNVGPGTYWFRVKACNNSGVWNEEGAMLEFMIAPAWYQTNWFRAACVAAFLAMVWGIYELRVRQLAAQFNMRLEERVAERTRVARDLHDTLLQSFQAVLPRLQAGINMLATRSADARRTLEQAADHASQAIAEGRDAVQGLRMSTVEKNDLAVAIRTVGEELASGASSEPSPNFNVVVEGASRNLHPILRDEVFRLATEALRNAFRHAAAQNIEVEIRYDDKYFRLRIRDDGKGIPSNVLSGDGREGHYGLPGMRERAKLVGGKLTIWTEVDGGTEIELNIPGGRAYIKPTRTFWHFGKLSATDTDEKEPIERE